MNLTYTAHTERIKGSTRSKVDLFSREGDSYLMRGWIAGSVRGALTVRAGAEIYPAILEERPDVDTPHPPAFTFGFFCAVPAFARAYEVWVDNVPTIRIRLEPRPEPLLTPPQDLIDAVGAGDFHGVGREFFDYFTLLAGLRPTDRVLDIGCGCGRIALQLVDYLGRGSYEGFDVNPCVLEWSAANITPRWPNFRFTLRQLYSSLYNRDAREAAAAAPFGYPDASFDFAIATSVFTHLLPSDCEHYLAESARVMTPGARTLFTWFLIDDATDRSLALGKGHLTFNHRAGPYARLHDDTIPEYAVAYDDAYIRELYKKNGLEIIEPVYYGAWRHRPEYLTFQDVIIASKSTSPASR